MSGDRGPSLADIPEALLGVIVDEARKVVQRRAPDSLGPALRPLARVDQRAAASSTVRRQFVTALSRDDGFRSEVATTLAARDDAVALLAGFDRQSAASCVTRAADADQLPLLVAALWAAVPDGWELAFGACAAVDLERQARRGLVEERDALVARLGVAEREALRAETTATAARAETAQTHAKLVGERAARRDADVHAANVSAERDAMRRELDAANAARDAREAELATLRHELAHVQARVQELERAVRDASATSSVAAAAVAAAAVTADELAALADASDELTRQLRAAASRVETAGRPAAVASPTPSSSTARPTAPVARTKPRLPAGLVADTVDGARAMLSQAGATLIVDGYNVSQRAWPEATAALQRDRLERGLQQVHQRFGCAVVCCYDGDDTVGAARRRTPGLRVVFSASHEEADEVVVETVRALPKRVPAVVASSDAWVREHAEALGAVVVSAATAVGVIQAAGRR